MLKKVNYDKSKKKQITYGLFFLVILSLIMFRLYPINTLEKGLYFGGISIILMFSALWFIRKAAQEAICPCCGSL